MPVSAKENHPERKGIYLAPKRKNPHLTIMQGFRPSPEPKGVQPHASGYVTVQVRDRLGNQMFLMAAAYSLAKKLNKILTLNKDVSSPLRGPRYWDTMFRWAPGFEVRKDETFVQFERVTPLTFNDYYTGQTQAENLSLQGLFDHPRYFQEVADELRAKFQAPRLLWARPAETNLYISVHVRRGDFVYLGNFELLPLSYYVRAMEFMTNFFDGNKQIWFLVFSDETNWCRTHFPDQFHYRYADELLESKAPEDHLWAMSQCDHHIIANSSFSWWGAYLGGQPSRKVIAPKYWYHPSKYRAREPYPDHWWVF